MGHHYTDQAMPINPTSDDPATVEAITRYLHERRVFDQLGEHRLYDTCRALNSLQRSMGDVPLLSATACGSPTQAANSRSKASIIAPTGAM